MENSLYNDFAAWFAAKSLVSLVDSFNCQVGNRGWTSARAAHDKALIDEFVRRGIDVTAVCKGSATSFAHKIVLEGNRLKIKG